MALPDHWEGTFTNGAFVSARMFCPHCKQPSTFKVVSCVIQNPNTYYAVIECNYVKCDGKVFIVTTNNNPQSRHQHRDIDTLVYYPTAPIPKPHESFPKPVAEDWTEAQKAMSVGAVKAAAVMCRRVLYGVLLDKQCTEHPLHQGIADLISRVRMPSIVEEWLGEIKDDGHDAAHPHRALEVPAENVVETMGYTQELLRFVYIEPFDLQKRLARKNPPAATTTAAAAPTGT